jgi:hypothetical protein
VNGLHYDVDAGFLESKRDTERAAECEKFYGEVTRRETEILRAAQDTRGSVSSGGDALRTILKASAGEYTPNKLQPVTLTKGMSSQVAEPTDNRCVDMMSAMSETARAFFEQDSDGTYPCLLSPAEVVDTSKSDLKWRWVGASKAGTSEYFKSVRDRTLWGYIKPNQAKALNGMFFLPKKDGMLRKIMACVPANARMKKAPTVDLPGPWQGARVQGEDKDSGLATSMYKVFTR